MLKIQGPVHFDNVDKIGILKNNPKGCSNPNTSGVYVWGFMYKYDMAIDFSDKEVLDYYYSNNCELPSDWKFLPYYVGKKESNIFSRIEQHQDIRNVKNLGSDADKYIRFSHDYMTKFFKDPLFPLKIGNPSRAEALIERIQTYPNSITYHNEKKVLQAIFPNLSITSLGNNHPITLQKINGVCIPDTLEDLVNKKNNFWFCFLPIKEDMDLIKKCESYIFWALKGKTISATEKSFSKIDKTIAIQDTTDTNIFIVNENNNLVVTNTFSGY